MSEPRPVELPAEWSRAIEDVRRVYKLGPAKGHGIAVRRGVRGFTGTMSEGSITLGTPAAPVRVEVEVRAENEGGRWRHTGWISAETHDTGATGYTREPDELLALAARVLRQLDGADVVKSGGALGPSRHEGSTP